MSQDPGFHLPYTSACRYNDKSFRLGNDARKSTLFCIRTHTPNALRRTGVGLCHQRKLLRQEYVAS